MKNIVAMSGGKDSTAMALLVAEQGLDFELLFTPAGNEPPELFDHVARIAKLVDKSLITISNRDLDFWIREFNALPNFRQRWCTRLLKIEPAIAYLVRHPGSTLLIGLRADEEDREGLYGEWARYRYPLREAGWGINDVWAYLERKGVTIPVRRGGNCKLCFFQRIGEWYSLWRDDPEAWAEGEAYETLTGKTFRTPGRDSWPSSLAELRQAFEAGKTPRGANQLRLLEDTSGCRVCTM
jgi:3'-phosphoadenosine 5'-phosphosulfate sulfotransferase (PAPS reductase)/FAD synthetase